MTSSILLEETAAPTTDCNSIAAAPPTMASITTSIQTSNSSKQNHAKRKPYKVEIVWFNVVLFAILHICAIYGLYLTFAEKAYTEFLYIYIVGFFGGLGITAGAHRLWCHRSYKAKLPLRICLMLWQTYAFQNHIYEWCRDHRVHHKFCDTNADPHNSNRGFFFSHIGWLMCKKHPDVKDMGKQIDMSDLLDDPVVMFQKKYYFILIFICWFAIPTFVPWYFIGSSLKVSFYIIITLRYCLSLHCTWLVNSAAHFYGMKPYDQHISATNSKVVSILAFGEGWHNYHHTFPWDYKTAELGNYYNSTTFFLNLMAKIGQAYDMKTASGEMLLKRIQRTGDGTHPSCTNLTNGKGGALEIEKSMICHFKDTYVTEEDSTCAKIIYKKDD